MSGWGLEFLSWFKRSPGLGDGGTGGLWWARTPTHLQLSPCLRCQQSPGTTLCFALLLFLLAKRGRLQGGQSMVRIEGKDDRENPLGSIPAAPTHPQEQLLSKPS